MYKSYQYYIYQQMQKGVNKAKRLKLSIKTLGKNTQPYI